MSDITELLEEIEGYQARIKRMYDLDSRPYSKDPIDIILENAVALLTSHAVIDKECAERSMMAHTQLHDITHASETDTRWYDADIKELQSELSRLSTKEEVK